MALTYSGLLLFCPQMGWGLGTQIPANIWGWTELVLLGAGLDLNTATRSPVLWQQGDRSAEHDLFAEGVKLTWDRLEPEWPLPSTTLVESDGVRPPGLGLR